MVHGPGAVTELHRLPGPDAEYRMQVMSLTTRQDNRIAIYGLRRDEKTMHATENNRDRVR